MLTQTELTSLPTIDLYESRARLHPLHHAAELEQLNRELYSRDLQRRGGCGDEWIEEDEAEVFLPDSRQMVLADYQPEGVA